MDDTKIFNPERYPLWTNDHVRFCDLDALGHVNNNAMGMYFENARAKLLSQITPGWPWGETIFVLVRTCITFRKELHMPARLKLGTCVTKTGNTSLQVANALYHGETPIAYSESTSVLIDNKSRKPVPLSEELRAIIAPFRDPTSHGKDS